MSDLAAVLDTSYDAGLVHIVAACLIVPYMEQICEKNRLQIESCLLTYKDRSKQHKTIFEASYVAQKV